MPWGKLTTGFVALGAALSGVDASIINEVPIQAEYKLIEHVSVTQNGNVVKATLPWKDQQGFVVGYDMGVPTARERVKDKRIKQVITEQVSSDAMKMDILLNEKPDTNRFCYTIEGAENYNFEQQPEAYTQFEIEHEAYRPEEMMGGFAVYHKTLHDNEYETGKVGNIPFPYIWEVDNPATKQRADSFTYQDGQLCVVVQQSFLDTATYPVRIDPTFGYSAIGASATALLVNETAGNLYIAPPDAGATSIAKFTLHTQRRLATDQFKAVLYDTSGNVITNGVGGAADAPAAYAWTDSSFATPPTITPGTSYGLNVVMSATVDYKYDTITGTYGLYDNTNSFASPQSITVADGSDYRLSLYATWNAAACDPYTTQCTDVFTTKGYNEWVAPTDVTSAKVACWGPGGGGGVVGSSGGGGGGGGAFASSTVSVTAGTGYTIFIGSGGNADNSASTSDSTFGTTTVVADGGKGTSDISAAAGGYASGSTGDVKSSGGNGGVGNATGDAGGGGGGAAGPHGAGEAGSGASTSQGGAGGLGDAGVGGTAGAADTNNATAPDGGNGGQSVYGGGGGGGGDNGDYGGNGGMYGGGGGGGEIAGGGQGADGRCEVSYTATAAPSGGEVIYQSEFFFF